MKVHPLTLDQVAITAIRAELKETHRVPVKALNTVVMPGSFDAADLGTARVRTSRHGTLTEIRARCELPSGPRVVTIGPVVQPGDLLWVRSSARAPRRESRLTLRASQVHMRRLQDMNDEEALAEGVARYSILKGARPRDRYAALWDIHHGAGSWARNGWVIVYHLEIVPGTIEKWIEHDARHVAERRA